MRKEHIDTPSASENRILLGRSPTSALSLRVNFVWTFLGNTVYAASQWAILVILAKLASPEVVGRFSLSLAVTTPIMMLANLNLRAVQVTDAKDEFLFGDYLGLRLVTTILAMIVVVGVVSLADYRQELGLLIIIIGLAKSIESISDIVLGLLQKHERMDFVAISTGIKGILSVATIGIVVWATSDILLGAFGLVFVWLVTLWLYDLRKARTLDKVVLNVHMPVMLTLARISLPLGIVMMLVSLSSNIPRYFIERLLGEQQLGYFAAMAYLVVVGNTVVGALGQSASPRLARHYANTERRAFLGLLSGLLVIGVLLGATGVAIALLFGKELLALLYTPDYAAHAKVFTWLMVAAGLSYVASFLGYSMTAARFFRLQLPLFILVVITLSAGCAFWVPVNGILGAAQAMVVAATIQLVGALLINLSALRSLASKFQPKEARI